MSEWAVGQRVVVTRYIQSGRTDVSEAEIVKIGRKWITVKNGWSEQRFGFDGLSDQDGGHRPRMWPDKATWEAYVQRRERWDELRANMRNIHIAPAHLSIEQIEQMLEIVARAKALGEQNP